MHSQPSSLRIEQASPAVERNGKANDAAAIAARLRDLLYQDKTFHFTPDLPDDASLVEAGAIDSFGMISLVIQMEQEFGTKVSPEEATVDRFRSIASIAAFIESKQNGNHRR
jgi:acyl carrier protein